MKYLSVCSGIEAATVAWSGLGWEAVAFAEVDPFCSLLLKEHYPEIPNLGDFTKIDTARLPAIDLLVGGTPCQDFSVAGARAGIDGARGNLTLAFLNLASILRPTWIVYENVPGLLSIGGGRTFAQILATLGQLGYGYAYRILDAQFVGGCPLHVDEHGIGPVPQRRRRVFVVARLGDWRAPAQVLFEPQSLPGYPAPGSEARPEVAGTVGGSASQGGWGYDLDRTTFIPDVAYGLNAHPSRRYDAQTNETFIAQVADTLRSGGNQTGGDRPPGTDVDTCETLIATTLAANSGRQQIEENYVIPILEAGARTGTSTDDPRAGIGVGEPGDPMFTLQRGKQHAIAFKPSHYTRGKDGAPSEVAYPLSADADKGDQDAVVLAPAVAVNLRDREGGNTAELGDEISASMRTGGGGSDKPHVLHAAAVRRLTVRECESLMNFPQDYTLIASYRKAQPLALLDYYHRTERGRLVTEVRKGRLYATPDGPRYRALGNSMVAGVMAWIGRRIQGVAG